MQTLQNEVYYGRICVFCCFIARKGNIPLAPCGKGVRRTGGGLLGKFLFLLGKNLCVPKDLFVFLQHETDDEVSFIKFLL